MAELVPLLVDAEDVAAIRQALRKIANVRGPGVTTSPDGITINPPQQVQRGTTQRAAETWFFARVMSSSADGTNRWSYGFEQVTKTGTGYGTWATFTGARTGTARNLIENMNSGSGVQGNGIDVADLSGTGLELQPAPAGAIVEMHYVVGGNENEVWFAYENSVGGPCEE